MKKLIYACLLGCCLALSACHSAKSTSTTNPYLSTTNPYLTHYLSSDSTVAGNGKAVSSKVDDLNKERLHEKVDPEGEESWADILRNILIYYQVGR